MCFNLKVNIMKGFLFLLILLFQLHRGFTFMDLFIDKNEVMQWRGIPYEIYYIKAGNIKQGAIDHNFKLYHNRSTFCWKSYTTVHYEVETIISDQKSLNDVKLSIDSEGLVPSNEETVTIEFFCSGLYNVDVLVEFHFLFKPEGPLYSDEVKIIFKRLKICKRVYPQLFDENESIGAENSDSSQLRIFYIVLCLGCSLFTVLTICIIAYILSDKKVRREDQLQTEQQIQLNPTETENVPYIVNTLVINSGTSTSSNISHNSIKKRSLPLPPDVIEKRVKATPIERHRIRLDKVEMEGTFGRVYIGIYLKDDGSQDEVIVKTVMDFATAIQVSSLVKEGLSMSTVRHRNIMTVFGITLDSHHEPYVIYLREGFTNLKKYLLMCKNCPEGITRMLTTQEVVDIAVQIVQGIQYMHKKKFLHKDLATRNCLIDDKLNVKITDNALSRDLFPNDYHCLGDNENRPVKWLAIESLVHRHFSVASDIWSFGVTLWELTTLAAQPYVEVDPFEVEHFLRDGYRLSQPVNCPDELFAVMAYCWAMSPSERPTFSQLLTCLQDFRNQLDKYV